MSVKEVEEMAKKHDWWYMMTEDSSVYYRGYGSRKELSDALRKLPEEDARRIYKKYSPYEVGQYDDPAFQFSD